jgi:hypothetical protein
MLGHEGPVRTSPTSRRSTVYLPFLQAGDAPRPDARSATKSPPAGKPRRALAYRSNPSHVPRGGMTHHPGRCARLHARPPAARRVQPCSTCSGESGDRSTANEHPEGPRQPQAGAGGSRADRLPGRLGGDQPASRRRFALQRPPAGDGRRHRLGRALRRSGSRARQTVELHSTAFLHTSRRGRRTLCRAPSRPLLGRRDAAQLGQRDLQPTMPPPAAAAQPPSGDDGAGRGDVVFVRRRLGVAPRRAGPGWPHRGSRRRSCRARGAEQAS